MNLADIVAEKSAFTPYHRGRTVRDPMDKHFIAWDGEGITPPGEKRQNYVLFGNSAGYKVMSTRLTTKECLSLIIDTELANKNAIHVGFAFSYDAEMILADLPLKSLSILRSRGNVYYGDYRIEFRPGKWFQVTDRESKVSARIWDVWGFFQSSFLAAVKEYTSISAEEYERLAAGKGGRSTFTYDELESIEKYWRLELSLTVDMMNDLRRRLFTAGYVISHWHGPAAIATKAFTMNGTRKVMDKNVSEEVNTAARYAYAGGRFELFQLGYHRGDVYAYDIRSAYPSAIRHLPNLATGEWRHVDSPKRVARFGVYRISFANPQILTTAPQPFFYRDAQSAIHFPNVMQGWVWSPEAKIALSVGATIHEGWEFDDDGSYPFSWVEDVYNTRAQWKREGNPSQMALKLLLNSLYGKMAQRVGWEKTGKAPTWHQYEWAGFVTSHARSQIYKAMLQAHSKGALLGVETDGIFSTAPLDLDVGSNLGQWECEQYEEMIYLQSGFYFKRTGKGWSSTDNIGGLLDNVKEDEWTAKYRGFDKGCVTVSDAMRALDEWKPWEEDSHGVVQGKTTRFSTMGNYLRSTDPESNRNVWHTDQRELRLGEQGKRVHRPEACRACRDKLTPYERTHDLTIHHPIGGLSFPRILPWLGVQEQVENHWHDVERHAVH